MTSCPSNLGAGTPGASASFTRSLLFPAGAARRTLPLLGGGPHAAEWREGEGPLPQRELAAHQGEATTEAGGDFKSVVVLSVSVQICFGRRACVIRDTACGCERLG